MGSVYVLRVYVLGFLIMRLRKRANWPVVVYRYWIEPEYQTWDQLPSLIQQEAEAMRALWNQLVDAFVQRQNSYHQSLPTSAPASGEDGVVPSAASSQTKRKPSALALRQIQQTFLRSTQEISKQSSVKWSNKQFITTQFFAAVTRFFNKQAHPPQPRSGDFHELHFQHRFTEGGLPVERLFGHSHRLCLTDVPPDAFSADVPQRQRKRFARTNGFFQVNGSVINFRTILHRPFPSGAFLKTAALVGKRVTPQGYHWAETGGHIMPAQWQWSLQLTLEIPPPEIFAAEDRRTAAVQIRCDLVDQQHLCFAILTDADGREEALFLPDPLLGSWQHKRMLQQQANLLLERTKRQLRSLPISSQRSPTVQHMFSHLPSAQAPGLWRLLQSLDQVDTTDESVEILRHWAVDSTKLLREARGVEQHSLGHRDWFYHNVAAQLCRRYRRLEITAIDPQTQTNQKTENNPTVSPSEVGTYRQLAAPNRFVSFVQQAASKTGTTVTITPRQPQRASRVEVDTFLQTQFSGEKLKL